MGPAASRSRAPVRPLATFEQALEVSRDLVGHLVEVSISGRDETGTPIASFAGKVGSVSRLTTHGQEQWWIWLEAKTGHGPAFVLSRQTFEGATLKSDGDRTWPPKPGEDEWSGTTWTLTVQQAGTVTSVAVFV